MKYCVKPAHCYAIQFNPCSKELACVANDNYGLRGGGYVFLFDTESSSANVSPRFVWRTGAINNFSWNLRHESLLFLATSDCKIVTIRSDSSDSLFVHSFHSNEVYDIDCSLYSDRLVSASWDKTAAVFLPNTPQPITVLHGHDDIVYSAKFSPTDVISSKIGTVSRDRFLKIWDTNLPPVQQNVISIDAHVSETLCLDWSKYEPYRVVTGGTEGLLKVWDLRNPTGPCFILSGHKYAVKDVKFSPFSPNQIISASYDFTVRLWDYQVSEKRNIELIDHHTEFVYGVDFSKHQPGLIADCAWDSNIELFTFKSLIK